MTCIFCFKDSYTLLYQFLLGTYVHDERCGNVGPFPGFRQLDCSKEISQESWSFYETYRTNCMKDAPPIAPTNPKPTPPKPVPLVPVPKPSPKQYVPPENKGGKPGIPAVYPNPTNPSPTDSNNNNNNMPTPAKKYVPPEEKINARHHFRNFIFVCIFGGAGYWIYKKRTEFDYGQFRMTRTRNYPPGFFHDNNSPEMYESLRMQESGTFQPPTLAPHPSAYGGHSGFVG